MGVYCQGVWFLDSTGSGQWDGSHTYWGWAGTLTPVVGNWTGSATKSQFGVYNQGAWFLDYDNSHLWDAANQAALTFYGWTGAQPVVGNWGSGFQAAAGQAAPSVLAPAPTAGQLQAAALPFLPDAALQLPLPAASQSGSEAAEQVASPLAVVPSAAGGGSDPSPGTSDAGAAPVSAPPSAGPAAINPLAVDLIDLAGAVEQALGRGVRKGLVENVR